MLVFTFILVKSAFTFVVLNDVEKELTKEHTALIYKCLRILTLERNLVIPCTLLNILFYNYCVLYL